MFTMMNSERLSVGIQGLGAAETSYQSAVAYARERIQGRSLSGAKATDKAADPIIVHPDVRRMLLTIRSYTEGCRALGGWVARELDEMERSDDPDARKRAEDFTALMTPVVKALFTDLGFEATNIGMQVYGGHGYIRDHGMEQLVRDARISMIYEGTNGIQALDLVGRKLPHGRRADAADVLPSGQRVHRAKQRPQATRRDDQGIRQGVRGAATGDGADRGEGDGGSRGSRRRRDRISAPVRPRGAGLYVGPGGGHRGGETGTSGCRCRVLQGETDHGAVLYGAGAAAGRRIAGRDQGWQGRDDGDARGSFLKRKILLLSDTADYWYIVSVKPGVSRVRRGMAAWGGIATVRFGATSEVSGHSA